MIRARETAEIVAKIHGAEVVVIEELHPNMLSLESIRKYVEHRALFVGHAPSIERVVSQLIGGRIRMKTGAIAGIELEEFGENKAVLFFLIIPDVVKKIVG